MNQPQRGVREYAGLAFRGMAMGAADVVPGVSGGTIAFISGIYDELIDSLRRFDQHAIAKLFALDLKGCWQYVNANFLLAVFGGVLLSILSLANVVAYLLETAPIIVWSFFIGLILSAGLHIARQIPRWNLPRVALLLLGVLLAVAVSELRPAQLPETWWMLMGAGAVAVCAMILPGVSGSFLLLMMGLYQSVINALTELNIVFIGAMGAGCVLGLLCFSHLLHWLLSRYHAATMALLTGFLLGSLKVIWPWKQTLESFIDRHGELVPLVQQNVWPQTYADVTGQPSLWLWALMAVLAGLLLVLLLEIWGQKSA